MRHPKKALSLLVVAALASVSIVVVANEAAAAVPMVTSLSPASGTVAGGTTVTVTGSGFYDGTSASAVTGVTAGGVAGTSVTVASDTSLTFVTPVRAGADRTAGPGAVVVTTSGGASAGSTLYTFRPVLESISSIPTGSSSQGLVTLGSLAAASQRKPVSRTTLQPYTVSGTYSAGTSVAAGGGYSYVTDRDYTGATAYQYESDERALRSGSSLTTTATIATGGGRSSTYKLTSAGNCEPRPNGATGSPTSNNYSDGYQTYCSVFGPEVYSE